MVPSVRAVSKPPCSESEPPLRAGYAGACRRVSPRSHIRGRNIAISSGSQIRIIRVLFLPSKFGTLRRKRRLILLHNFRCLLLASAVVRKILTN